MDPSSLTNIKSTTMPHNAYENDLDDGPTHRAMAIGSVAEVVTFPTMFPSMLHSEHLRENALQLGKPSLSPAMPPLLSERGTPTTQCKSPKPNDLVWKSNWKQPAGDCGGEWILPSIPRYYPLENTSEHISADTATPAIIAARVSDACAKMSICAVYNSEKGIAHLTSEDFVDFYVFLFKTSASNDSRGDGVVIEVQRRKGCTLSFHRYAHNILSAALGEDDIGFDECATPAWNDASAPLASETKMMEGEDFKTCLKTERKHIIDALEIAGNLLAKDRLDANILGMESLCLLTDSSKTGRLTSALVSRVILCGTMRPINGGILENEEISEDSSSEDEAYLIESLDLRARVMSLIQYKKLSAEFDDESSDEEDYMAISNREQYGNCDDHMHNLALATLSNALHNIAKEGHLGETCSQQPWLNSIELVSTLMNVLKQAEGRPHDAVLSARCLGSLVQASKEATERAIKMDALTVVEAARRAGDLRHANLARETSGLHQKLVMEPVNI